MNKSKYIKRCDLSLGYKRYRVDINKALNRVFKNGVYTLGKEVKLFEDEFARYIGSKYGVSVASGTDALILALKAGGIAEGDRVITTTYAPTPVATAIVLAGGIPVFCDIEEDTCLINPVEIKKKISKKTRFIIPVHIFGSVSNMNAVNAVARKEKLTVIEDSAQAHGSMFDGKKAGSFGRFSSFSFYPTKNLASYGDGGIILTNDRASERLLRLLRNYGKKYNPFDSEILGYNSRLDEIQAAILRVKLRYLDDMNRKRAGLVNLYKKGLRDLPLRFLKEYDNVKSNYHILNVLCEKKRNSLIKYLNSHKIQTNIYYPRALHLMPAFRRYAAKNEKFPVSEKISKEILALPLYPEFKKKKAGFVIDKIKKYFQG